MTRRGCRRRHVGVRVVGVVMAMGLALASGVAVPELSAQATGSVLAERRLEYRAARDAWEAARSAFSVVERQFSAALEQVGRARRSGDDDALEDAFALAQDRSVPYRAQEARVEDARDRLDEARQALINVITVRLGELLAQLDEASSAAARAQLDARWQDLRNEQQELEAEDGDDDLQVMPVILPEITFDPRDGPEELEAKAQILERLAAVADTVVGNLDQERETLTTRLRIERQRQDFLAGTDRFDDIRVPVVTNPGSGERPAAADSTMASRPLTLEERLEALERYREQLVSYRDQLLIRARQFRERVRRMP